MLKVHHLDDSLAELKAVEKLLCSTESPCKFQVESFSQVARFRERLVSGALPDIALIDIHLEGQDANGVSIAAEVRASHPDVIVIIRSSDINQTALAASAGVHDYIDKDADGALLAERLFFNAEARKPTTLAIESGTIIGETIGSMKPQVERVKKSAVKTVHIYGETGCGKEVVAKLFGPIRTLDCGAIPENLVESELFGHKKGAYTGATHDKKGALDVSTGGWIFLDEIGNISLATQAKLLRAIGEKEISPLGAADIKKVNFKLITATNVDLREKTKRGEFREDLRQRLTEFEISLPPLRERISEIDDLIDHFCKTLDGGPYTIETPARNLLKSFDYQEGNVRELRRALINMTANKLPGNVLSYSAVPQYIIDGVSEITGLASSDDLFEKIKQIKETNASEELTVTWRRGERWENLWNRCLWAAIRVACKDSPKSYRELAPIMGMQRNTLSKKISEMSEKGMLAEAESKQLFKGSN
jgi:DNA-binding NtrC family response regulator